MYPVLLDLGCFQLRSYGLSVVLAILTAIWYASREWRRQGVDPAVVTDSAMLIAVAGLVGSWLYSIAFSQPAYYLAHRKAAHASPWSPSEETGRSSPGSSSRKR